jgi:hypothetical protein
MALPWKQVAWMASIALLAAGATAAGIYMLSPRGAIAPAAGNTTTTSDALHEMKLQEQFAGPLKDTVIQRWEDPATGTVCYLYLPITVQHSPPTPTGYVQYGANYIGSISCLPPR